MGRTAPVETHPAQRTRSGPGRSGPTSADDEPVRPALLAPVPVPGLLTGTRAEGRAVRRDVELRDISAYRKTYPVRAWVVENTDFTLRNVVLEFPSYDHAVGYATSPEYAEAKALRQGAGSIDITIVEGV